MDMSSSYTLNPSFSHLLKVQGLMDNSSQRKCLFSRLQQCHPDKYPHLPLHPQPPLVTPYSAGAPVVKHIKELFLPLSFLHIIFQMILSSFKYYLYANEIVSIANQKLLEFQTARANCLEIALGYPKILSIILNIAGPKQNYWFSLKICFPLLSIHFPPQ